MAVLFLIAARVDQMQAFPILAHENYYHALLKTRGQWLNQCYHSHRHNERTSSAINKEDIFSSLDMYEPIVSVNLKNKNHKN